MSYNIPEELKYTKDHEWAKIEGDVAIIGISDYAQSALGDIVYVELPEVGKNLERHQAFGVVESIKSVSDLYSPLSGTVIEINESLVNSPEACNQGPYDTAWMIKIRLSSKNDLSGLLSASEYKNFLSSL